MKRVQLISSVILASTCLFGLTMVRYPGGQANVMRGDRLDTDAIQTTQPPVKYKYLLGLLPLAAKPLAYLPQMQQAIAAHSPAANLATPLTDAEVTLFGVGPLRIGMTLSEASEALGVALLPLGGNLSGECAYYQPETKDQFLGLMAVGDRIIRIDIWPGSTLETVSGAAIGMTKAEIADLYPGQIEATPNPYIKGQFLTLVPSDPEFALYRMVFETDAEDTVVQYRTGQFPAVTWPDGCV